MDDVDSTLLYRLRRDDTKRLLTTFAFLLLILRLLYTTIIEKMTLSCRARWSFGIKTKMQKNKETNRNEAIYHCIFRGRYHTYRAI